MEVVSWRQISLDISSVTDSEAMNKLDQKPVFVDLISQGPNDWNVWQI